MNLVKKNERRKIECTFLFLKENDLTQIKYIGTNEVRGCETKNNIN